MLEIRTIKIDSLKNSDFIKEYKLLSQAQVDKLSPKKNDDKHRSLAALILLRRMIKEKYSYDSYTFSYNENGKPLLDFCYLSIAHTENMALVAISDQPVGVDIEKIREIKMRNDYRFFSYNEVRYVNSSPVGVALRFFEIWTKKEAYIKLMGLKLSDSARFDVLKLDNVIFETKIYNDNYITICT